MKTEYVIPSIILATSLVTGALAQSKHNEMAQAVAFGVLLALLVYGAIINYKNQP